MNEEPQRFKKGDVVLNGYAAPGINDLHIITGFTSRKTSRYSTTSYYKSRCLYKGKLQHESLFSRADNKLTKIGHVDYEGYIVREMEAIKQGVLPKDEGEEHA